MSATKILWGQILVVFVIVLTTIWTATQWTAWQLGFQPQLGRPWFELFGWQVYHPPAFSGGGISTTPMRRRFWSDDVQGHALTAGHFFPEEAPEQTAEALDRFFSDAQSDIS